YLEARYNLALCRFNYAMAQTKTPTKHKLLESARGDITVTAILSEDLGGGEMWAKFNKLYRDIQQKMIDEGHPAMKGKDIADLEKRIKVSEEDRLQAEAEKKAAQAEKKSKPKTAKAAVAKKPESGGGMLGTIIV